MSKEQEVRTYLQERVDPFLKPLLVDLIKQQPENVHEFISQWLEHKGHNINAVLNGPAPEEHHKSVSVKEDPQQEAKISDAQEPPTEEIKKLSFAPAPGDENIQPPAEENNEQPPPPAE